MLASRKSLIVIKFIGSTSDLPAGTPESCQEDPQTLPGEHMLPKEERALGIKDKKTKDKYVNEIWLQNEWRLEETSLVQKKRTKNNCFHHNRIHRNVFFFANLKMPGQRRPQVTCFFRWEMCVPYFAAVNTLFLSSSRSEVNNTTQLVISSVAQSSK